MELLLIFFTQFAAFMEEDSDHLSRKLY